MTIGGIPLEVSARINHCHTPIDVTFLVQSESTILKNFSPGTDDEEQPVEVRYLTPRHLKDKCPYTDGDRD